MIDNLCYVKPEEVDDKEPKSLVYKNMSDNIPEIIESINLKYCIPDYYIQSGNSNRNTATDRFNQKSYDALVNELQELYIESPGVPED